MQENNFIIEYLDFFTKQGEAIFSLIGHYFAIFLFFSFLVIVAISALYHISWMLLHLIPNIRQSDRKHNETATDGNKVPVIRDGIIGAIDFFLIPLIGFFFGKLGIIGLFRYFIVFFYFVFYIFSALIKAFVVGVDPTDYIGVFMRSFSSRNTSEQNIAQNNEYYALYEQSRNDRRGLASNAFIRIRIAQRLLRVTIQSLLEYDNEDFRRIVRNVILQKVPSKFSVKVKAKIEKTLELALDNGRNSDYNWNKFQHDSTLIFEEIKNEQ